VGVVIEGVRVTIDEIVATGVVVIEVWMRVVYAGVQNGNLNAFP
jgi:hypothetical protein